MVKSPFSKTPALDTTKVYWARRRGEHSRLERTVETRAEVGGGGGGEEAGAGRAGSNALCCWGGRPFPPPSSSALLLGGGGISVKPYKTAAVSKYGKRSSGENLWSTKPVVSPAYPPTASRARGTPVSFLLLSCLAAPLLQGGKILLPQPIRRGTAESTAGCTT